MNGAYKGKSDLADFKSRQEAQPKMSIANDIVEWNAER
jgi:hypothetical protein